MRAAAFVAPGEPLHIREVPTPQAGPADLILKVKACGICGTDLHLAGLSDSAGGMTPLHDGAIMGHEFSGEVVEVGRDARDEWKVGDRVCALPYMACGRCRHCLDGAGHRCADVTYGGLGKLAGAYADYVRVGVPETLRLPASVDYRLGAMVEPLSVSLHAVHAARLSPGDAVLVIGAGPIGLGVAMWCRFFGARHVVVSDLKPGRLETAAALGATDGIDASRESVTGRFKQIAGGRPDVVFDCVGVPGSQQLAMDYAPNSGRIVVAGLCMSPDTILPVKAVTKELTVAYVMMYRRQDFAFTIEMLGRERIDPRPMVTEVVGFDGFADAFEGLKRPSHHCKILLEPELDGH